MFASRKATKRLAALPVAGGLILVALALTASSATAGFPGVNGKIAFSRCEDGYNCAVGTIWTMNPDGSGQARLFSDPGYWDDAPSYSANGHMLVFQRCLEGQPYGCGIATVDARGHGLKQLTPMADPTGDNRPGFSPDGSRIVFERFARGPDRFQIWIMGADGSNARALTSGPDGNAYPEFSPDGKHIVYNRYSGDSSRIWLMNADGSNQHPITGPNNRYDNRPSFSPDGTRVAFGTAAKSGECRIRIVNVDGTGDHQVTNSQANDFSPAFSPDGTQIVFDRDTPGDTTAVYRQALSGGQAIKLANGDDYDASWGRVPIPSIDSPPKVVGVARAGHALTATAGPGSWGGSASFQWLRCTTSCAPIAGATAATYKPTNADVGKKLEVRQTQTSAGGSVSAISAVTAAVAAEPGASLVKLVRAGKSRLVASLTCPATQSVVCNGRLTVTARVHGHTVKIAAGSYKLVAGTNGKFALRATKALHKTRQLTARLLTRDDAGNSTKTKRTLELKRG
jgi:WD40 repeat protein